MSLSLRWVSILTLLAFAGCGVFLGGRRHHTYVTPDGYPGSIAQNGPIILDAVYMNDSTRGIEGVVRLTWWNVFAITVQNRSNAPLTLPVSAFSVIRYNGQVVHPLPLDKVLNYESYVIGPLMSYQRRAIRRAFWADEPIAPGAFAVGYLFFPRSPPLGPCQLVLDPDSTRKNDEVVASFALPKPAEEKILAPVASPTPAVSESTAVSPPSTAPATLDTTKQAIPAAAPAAPDTSAKQVPSPAEQTPTGNQSTTQAASPTDTTAPVSTPAPVQSSADTSRSK